MMGNALFVGKAGSRGAEGDLGRRTHVIPPLALAACCALLAQRVYDEWRRLAEPVFIVPQAATAGAGTTLPSTEVPLWAPSADVLPAIAERPLFSPTRRPPVAAAAPAPQEEILAPAAPPPAVDFTLVGIVTAGENRFALVERRIDSRVIEVRQGGEISGWFAVVIYPERAVFRQDAFEEELVLKYETPVPPERNPARRTPDAPSQIIGDDRESPPSQQQQ
jgi:hypothetical protein